jgi:NarL family two-component system sensor histidine kinase LiaS
MKCPAFLDRLWRRLSLTFFLLSSVCMVILMLTSSSILNSRNLHNRVNHDYIEAVLQKQNNSILSPMLEKSKQHWPTTMAAQLGEELYKLEGPDEDGMLYSIDMSSTPLVEVRILDEKQTLVSHYINDEKRTFSEKAVIVSHAVKNNQGEVAGIINVKLEAAFDTLLDAKNSLNWIIGAWPVVIVSSAVMGIVFGIVASKYVTGRLRNMNLVIEQWRQGNFDARISLPSDDELTKHSQHLNDMAQDLELFLSLKQGIAVSDERNRVARELHDTVKQKLFALGLQLAVAKSKPAVMEAAAEHVVEAETITREAQHDLMEIITQLRPAGTSDSSLCDRIAAICDDFKRRFNVDIQLIRSPNTHCTTNTEHHVVRIVQEALINAVRHGKASKISVTNQIDQDRTVLVISDNGLGFDASKKTGGFGITSMRDRVSDLPQGKFDIKSNPETGTQIIISWKNET